MNRRQWLGVGGAGIAAMAGGATWYARRHPAIDTEFFWAMRFPQPGGGELVMADRRGRPLLLNFWATWCAPCIKEMPTLDRFQRDHAADGWQVVGLAIDSPTPVREFLQRTPVSFAIGLAGMEGAELAEKLGNPMGALPYTVVFDAHGRVAQRKLGITDAAELNAWAKGV